MFTQQNLSQQSKTGQQTPTQQNQQSLFTARGMNGQFSVAKPEPEQIQPKFNSFQNLRNKNQLKSEDTTTENATSLFSTPTAYNSSASPPSIFSFGAHNNNVPFPSSAISISNNTFNGKPTTFSFGGGVQSPTKSTAFLSPPTVLKNPIQASGGNGGGYGSMSYAEQLQMLNERRTLINLKKKASRKVSAKQRDQCKTHLPQVAEHFRPELSKLCNDLDLVDEKSGNAEFDINALEDDKAGRLVEFVTSKMKTIIAHQEIQKKKLEEQCKQAKSHNDDKKDDTSNTWMALPVSSPSTNNSLLNTPVSTKPDDTFFDTEPTKQNLESINKFLERRKKAVILIKRTYKLYKKKSRHQQMVKEQIRQKALAVITSLTTGPWLISFRLRQLIHVKLDEQRTTLDKQRGRQGSKTFSIGDRVVSRQRNKHGTIVLYEESSDINVELIHTYHILFDGETRPSSMFDFQLKLERTQLQKEVFQSWNPINTDTTINPFLNPVTWKEKVAGSIFALKEPSGSTLESIKSFIKSTTYIWPGK